MAETIEDIIDAIRKSTKKSVASITARRLESHGGRDRCSVDDAITCLRDDDRFLRDIANRLKRAIHRERKDRFKRGSADAKIAFDYTPRAFVRGSFRDRNGKECSIQESSLATEPCIWLGMDRADICVMSSESHNLPPPKLVLEEGSTENSGWKKYVLPDKVHDFCRMELTREMALELSGLLLYFAERGTLPAPKAPRGRAKKGGAE